MHSPCCLLKVTGKDNIHSSKSRCFLTVANRSHVYVTIFDLAWGQESDPELMIRSHRTLCIKTLSHDEGKGLDSQYITFSCSFIGRNVPNISKKGSQLMYCISRTSVTDMCLLVRTRNTFLWEKILEQLKTWRNCLGRDKQTNAIGNQYFVRHSWLKIYRIFEVHDSV